MAGPAALLNVIGADDDGRSPEGTEKKNLFTLKCERQANGTAFCTDSSQILHPFKKALDVDNRAKGSVADVHITKIACRCTTIICAVFFGNRRASVRSICRYM
jgi:hypothetical protein